MTISELTKVISDCCNDVTFVLNGKTSGITSEVRDSIPTFQVWYGDQTKEYNDVQSLMSDNFFGGRSLKQLASSVKFTFS